MASMTRIIVLISALTIVLVSCTAVNQVRTVGKGNSAVEISLGGPMFTNLGGAMPVPNILTGYRYGVRRDMDISAVINITGLIMPGVFDVITGVHWIPIQPGIGKQSDSPSRGWNLSGSATVQWVTDFNHGLVVFPAIELIGGRRFEWFNPFFGASCGFNFYRYDKEQSAAIINPFIGCEFIIRERTSLGIKTTLWDCMYNYYDSQVNWVYFTDDSTKKKKRTIFGISIGFSRIFGH
jgi:hypothetical protein